MAGDDLGETVEASSMGTLATPIAAAPCARRVAAPPREEPTMPRKIPPKPPSVTHLCWAWRARQKARGQRLEVAGDQTGADACRCHRRARVQTGRCRRHGGTARRGPTHHAYTHGRYSTLSVGILRPKYLLLLLQALYLAQ